MAARYTLPLRFFPPKTTIVPFLSAVVARLYPANQLPRSLCLQDLFNSVHGGWLQKTTSWLIRQAIQSTIPITERFNLSILQSFSPNNCLGEQRNQTMTASKFPVEMGSNLPTHRWLAVSCMALCLWSAVGCSSSEDTPAAAKEEHDKQATLGDFKVSVHGDSSLQITLGDKTILEGLGAGTIADDELPIAGYAVRNTAYSYEMLYGSFKYEDTPQGPWQVGSSIAVRSGDGINYEVRDPRGTALLSVQIQAKDARHLVLDFSTTNPEAKRLSWGFRCQPNERFVGFGSQSWDVDQSGQKVPLLVSEQGIGKATTDEFTGVWYLQGRRHSAQWPMPWTLSNRGMVMVAETRHQSLFDLCSPDHPDAARVELELPGKIHLFVGDSVIESTSLATKQWGTPRVPPAFAFAPWNDAIKGPDKVLGAAQRLRQADVPSSVIWTEDWRGAEQSGDRYELKEEWEVDPSLYPDMKGMTDQLHQQGFKFFNYFNSFVYQNSKAWQETASKGLLIKNADGTPYLFDGAKFSPTSLLDVTNPEARAWAKSKMKAGMELGADGWMNDFAEWLPMDSVLTAGSGLDLHNEYPVYWQQIAREAIDEMNDGVERLFFARSGWFGTPPLTDVFWAGDQRTNMDEDDGLPSVVVMGINLSVTGCPSYGHDIAGYQAATNAGSDKEVFWRWTELGAFSPVMRTHHGLQADKNWTWESDAETIAFWRTYTIEHITLAPMFQAWAKQASETGVPIMRGLFLHYPENDQAWTVKDEYLLGPSILVAPVIQKGATSRSVWFPPGVWYPWKQGSPQMGNTSLAVQAPVGDIPVFVKAGSLLVKYPSTIRTLANSSATVPGPEQVGDDRELWAFMQGSSDFTEVGGLKYTWTSPETGVSEPNPTMMWNNAALATCSQPVQAPCFVDNGNGETVAYVVGNGELSVGSTQPAKLNVSGGKDSRNSTIHIRR
jgi:sulfoquinovosidase